MDKKKIAVFAIGIYVIVIGVIGILSSYYDTRAFFGTKVIIIYNLGLLAYVITGFYLVRFQNWARLVIIFSAAVSCLTSLFAAAIFLPHLNSVVSMSNQPVTSVLIKFIFFDVFMGIVVQGLVLFYLTRPKLNEIFKVKRITLGWLIIVFCIIILLGIFLVSPFLLFKTPAMKIPAVFKKPSVLQGDGVLKKVKFLDVPSLGAITDIVVGNLPKTLGAEFGIAGVWGAVFISPDLKVRSSVGFRYLSHIDIIDIDKNGTLEFMNRGAWIINPSILNRDGSVRWVYGNGRPGVNDMALGHFDNGQTGFVVGFNGDGGIHLLDKNGKKLWAKNDANVWHVETIDI